MADIIQRINLAGLQQFVLKRLSPEGGFAATPMQPHTIQDTFYGVEIFFFLQDLLADSRYREIVRDVRTRDYLNRFASNPGQPVLVRTVY